MQPRLKNRKKKKKTGESGVKKKKNISQELHERQTLYRIHINFILLVLRRYLLMSC